jgi:hypothetical protein
VPEPTGLKASTPSPRYPSNRAFPLCPSHHVTLLLLRPVALFTSARSTSNGATTTTFAPGSAQLAAMAASPWRSGSSAPSRKRGLRTISSLSATRPSAHLWRGSRTGTTRSGRTLLGAGRRRTRSFMDDVPPTAAGALSRGRGTRRMAPVQRHGRRPGPRLEHDTNSWPLRSGGRGTWRRSRSDGETDWFIGDTVFAQGDVCLTSPKERRMACFRSLESPKRLPDAFSAIRSVLESRGQNSRLPRAIVDGPVQGTNVACFQCAMMRCSLALPRSFAIQRRQSVKADPREFTPQFSR